MGGSNGHLQQILAAFECPTCRTSSPRWKLAGPGHRLSFDNSLLCTNCSTEFQSRHGYLDLYPVRQRVTPIQRLMQIAPIVRFYEAAWRPFGYFVTSKHSLRRDYGRLASMFPRQSRIIVDVACGPGNFTREIARSRPQTTVIGIDISEEMLERAVQRSRAAGLSNVFYMRASALAIPLKAASMDGVSCFGALQILPDVPQALGEMARILSPGGDLIGQTVVETESFPFWARVSDRFLKLGYFQLDALQSELREKSLDLVSEEQSKISYVFKARRRAGAIAPDLPAARTPGISLGRSRAAGVSITASADTAADS